VVEAPRRSHHATIQPTHGNRLVRVRQRLNMLQMGVVRLLSRVYLTFMELLQKNYKNINVMWTFKRKIYRNIKFKVIKMINFSNFILIILIKSVSCKYIINVLYKEGIFCFLKIYLFINFSIAQWDVILELQEIWLNLIF